MIRISILFVLFFCLTVTAQKKKNGTIYIEHPAIETVNAMFTAYVEGDAATVSSHLAEDFKSFNGTNGNPDAEGGTSEDFLEQMIWMKENINYLTISPSEGAYPDALEYADSGTWVQTWDHLRGVHNKTGVKIDMPMHRLIVVNDENKIKTLINYFDMRIPQEISRSFTDLENGKLYKNHEHINSVRKMMHAFEFGDFEAAYGYFDANARFNSLELPVGETMSLEEVKARNTALWEEFDFKSIDVVGYPDYLEYDLGDAKVVQSWWNFRLTRKSDKKEFVIPAMYIHDFNDDGKIIRSNAYVSTKLLDSK